MNPERLVCVLIPEFPLQVCVRDSAYPMDKPVVVAEANKAISKLIAINQPARVQRITTEMTVAQAGVYCPELKILIRDIEREQQVTRSILKLLQQVGPCVETSGDGIFYLKASGLTRLYGSETGIIAEIFRIVQPVSYPIQIGVGCNKLIAGIAAHHCHEGDSIIVPTGEEVAFLGPLDVSQLRLPVGTVKKLHELGIRTIADLGRFPAHEITFRFGDEVIALARYARGEDLSLFLPARLSFIRMSRFTFEFSITTRTILHEYLKEMFEELLKPLRQTSEGGKTINVICYCSDGSSIVVPVSLDNPTTLSVLFHRQAEVCFEQVNLTGGITEIVMVLTESVMLKAEQLELDSRTGSRCPIPERMMQNLFEKAVYAITPISRSLPEDRYSLAALTPQNKRKSGENVAQEKFANYTSRPVSGMRLLSEPRVSTIEAQDGRLLAVHIKGKRYAILNQRGPWRLSGGWWSKGFERLYYDIETIKHQSLLVFYDLEGSAWYLQGVFD